jgi:hypothetical protein
VFVAARRRVAKGALMFSTSSANGFIASPFRKKEKEGEGFFPKGDLLRRTISSFDSSTVILSKTAIHLP